MKQPLVHIDTEPLPSTAEPEAPCPFFSTCSTQFGYIQVFSQSSWMLTKSVHAPWLRHSGASWLPEAPLKNIQTDRLGKSSVGPL